MQYCFAAAIALLQVKGSKMKTAYMAIAMIFAVLAINELSFFTSSMEEYSQVWSATPVYMFSLFIIFVFIAYEIYIRWKKQLD